MPAGVNGGGRGEAAVWRGSIEGEGVLRAHKHFCCDLRAGRSLSCTHSMQDNSWVGFWHSHGCAVSCSCLAWKLLQQQKTLLALYTSEYHNTSSSHCPELLLLCLFLLLLCLQAPAKRALVVGGGDGGVLRELARHPSLEVRPAAAPAAAASAPALAVLTYITLSRSLSRRSCLACSYGRCLHCVCILAHGKGQRICTGVTCSGA